MFQILNGRQISLYLYLSMLMGDDSVCYPTTFQIANDLGLSSSTMVFEGIRVLEDFGFILRARRTIPNLRSRRNVYQRPACEYTILQLLREKRIDGHLRARPYSYPVSAEAAALMHRGLEGLLGVKFAEYHGAGEQDKEPVLRALLEELQANKRL